jgi:hypothetical protein
MGVAGDTDRRGRVGGAAYLEYRRAQTEAAARPSVIPLIAALEADEPAARRRAGGDHAPTPEGAVLLALLAAGEVARDDDREAAAARLRATAEAADLPPRYRDLALLKAHLLHPEAAEQARLVLACWPSPARPMPPWPRSSWRFSTSPRATLEAGIERLRRLEIAARAPRRPCSSARGS